MQATVFPKVPPMELWIEFSQTWNEKGSRPSRTLPRGTPQEIAGVPYDQGL